MNGGKVQLYSGQSRRAFLGKYHLNGDLDDIRKLPQDVRDECSRLRDGMGII